MTDYSLTRHAECAMQERGIAVAWLDETLQDPDAVEADRSDPQLVHHLRVIHTNGGRVLRVVINCHSRPPRVVTVYFDRAMKGMR